MIRVRIRAPVHINLVVVFRGVGVDHRAEVLLILGCTADRGGEAEPHRPWLFHPLQDAGFTLGQ